MAPANAQAAAAQADAGSDPRTQSILRAVDQAAPAGVSADNAERAGFTRNFVMSATDMRDGGDADGQSGNRVVQALGRKYRPATVDAVRLKREGAV